MCNPINTQMHHRLCLARALRDAPGAQVRPQRCFCRLLCFYLSGSSHASDCFNYCKSVKRGIVDWKRQDRIVRALKPPESWVESSLQTSSEFKFKQTRPLAWLLDRGFHGPLLFHLAGMSLRLVILFFLNCGVFLIASFLFYILPISSLAKLQAFYSYV